MKLQFQGSGVPLCVANFGNKQCLYQYTALNNITKNFRSKKKPIRTIKGLLLKRRQAKEDHRAPIRIFIMHLFLHLPFLPVSVTVTL